MEVQTCGTCARPNQPAIRSNRSVTLGLYDEIVSIVLLSNVLLVEIAIMWTSL